MSDLSSQIGQILANPEMMEQIKSISGLMGASEPEKPAQLQTITNFIREDDDTIRLLRAIKPFLSPDRQERIERAIKILKIIKLVPLIKQQGIFDML